MVGATVPLKFTVPVVESPELICNACAPVPLNVIVPLLVRVPVFVKFPVSVTVVLPEFKLPLKVVAPLTVMLLDEV